MKHQPVALLDACVLVPMPLADTLLRLAEPPAIFDARWSEDILGEMSRTLVHRFAKTPADAGSERRQWVNSFHKRLVWLSAPHQPNGQSSERLPCPGRGARLQGRLLGHLQSPGFPRDDQRSHNGCRTSTFLKTLWKLDRFAIEVCLREQAVAIGFGVEELLDRLAQSIPAFVELLRSRD